jgi:hypothetical protein
MRRLQILYYLTHVNTWELLLYLMPVASIFCIAIAHLKMFNYASKIRRTSETRKVYWILRYVVIFNLIMLFAICLRYLNLHEPPEKNLIFKKQNSFNEAMF